jgi:hypothetical protein
VEADGLLGRAAVPVLAAADLDEHQHLSIEAHEVELAPAAGEVALEDDVA